jgi:F-type H+-transporting ATPase subunit b
MSGAVMAMISSAFAAETAQHESSEGAGHGAAAGTQAHGGAHEAGFPPFQVENFVPQLIWLALIFGLLYLLMSRLALPRVANILSTRESTIAADLDASRELQAKAQAAAKANEDTLRAKRDEAQAIGREAQQKIAADVAAQRTAAEKDFSDKLGAADARIATAKGQALSNVETIATDAAAAIIQKLTGAHVDAATLVSEYHAVKSR